MRFILSWFDPYGNWLEYSVKVEKAFCLCCYLFRDDIEHQGGDEAFVTEGFNGWKKTKRFIRHVGDFNSFHNRALQKCEALMNHDQSVAVAFNRRSEQERKDYRIRLHVSVISTRYCLNGELSIRGHDEKVASIYRGNYLELVKLIRLIDKNIGAVLKRAPKNCQLLCPKIQKQIATCFEEVLETIFKEIRDDVFALLVDESSDVTKKEQMAIIFCYVNKNGLVKESLVVVVVARKHLGVVGFFDKLSLVTNVVCDSCKRKDILIECEKLRVEKAIGNGEVETRSALQKKDQDIVEAVSLVKSTKEQLKDFRVNGFVPLLTSISSFCEKHNIRVLNMDENQEFSDCFSEAGTEILTNMACLNLSDSFAQFDTSNLVRLSELYPNDFDNIERLELESQLNLYYANVHQQLYIGGRWQNTTADAHSITYRCILLFDGEWQKKI
ncbi:zinc finger MYM-type protein 1-like protein [Tanacetum coccineum]